MELESLRLRLWSRGGPGPFNKRLFSLQCDFRPETLAQNVL